MNPWMHRLSPDTDPGRDLPERRAQAARAHGRPDTGEEERARARPGAQTVTLGRIAAQHLGGGRVQRHEPGAIVLGVPDGDQAGVEVDVVALERDRLADPHAGHGEQPEQRLVARRAQRMRQPARFCQQPADVRLGEQVGGGAPATSGEHAGRRDLGRWVDRLQVAGERPDDPEPFRPLVRINVNRQPRPTDREFGGDRGRARGLDISDELRELAPVLLELEPERATHPQIVIGMLLEAAHRSAPPGHGAARSRSRSTSTRA